MTTRKLITTACITVLSSIAFSVAAQMPTTMPAPTASMDTRTAERDLDVLNAQIKTNADLNAYLAANTKTPFDAFPQSERQVFLDSLMFSTKSLGSFNYAVLEDNLTPTEIYAVLTLFGHQQLTSRLDGARVNTTLDRAILQINSPKSKATTGDDFGAFGTRLLSDPTGKSLKSVSDNDVEK